MVVNNLVKSLLET